MLGAFDLFIHPSLFDGVPMVILEAQAAGLPCVMSDAVAEESDVVAPLLTRLPLSRSPQVWAEAALRAHIPGRDLRRKDALARMERSPFNIDVSVGQLAEFYRRCVA